MKRNEKLIRTRFLQYLLPSVMTAVALQLGNVVDTVLVGNILGTDAMSAVQIGSTMLLVIQIPGYMLGVGGSIAVGNLLGRRDRDGASKTFSATMAWSVIFGFLFILLAAFSNQFAVLLAGESSLTPTVADVIRITLIGSPIIGIALQMMNYMAVDNTPSLATLYVVISNIINLTADYLLLKYTPLGAKGAILSTFIGYVAAFAAFIPYFLSKKRMLHFTNPFSGCGEVMKQAVVTGVPSMLVIVCEIIRNWALNIIIISAIGDDAVAVYTVGLNFIMICELFLGGIIGTMASIGGVIYGEKDYYGIRALSRHIIIFCYAVLAVLMAALLIFTKPAAAMFGIREGALMDSAVAALRIFVFSLPFYVYNRFIMSYYQTTEKTWLSNLITVLEYCGALLPAAGAAIALAASLGYDRLNALMAAFIVGEAVTMVIAIVAVKVKYRRGVLVLPDSESETVLDFSIAPTLDEAVKVPRSIREFCSGKLDEALANRLAVAAEEIAVNIIKHGGSSVRSIDVMLCILDGSVIFRTRDAGIPFDPTNYAYDSEGYEFRGIEVIRDLTDSVAYMRMLDFNNTTIEINTKEPQKAS